jgi:6-pyruvoyltetrahydropterin/6-carboxytetrahydropterin synthase
MSYQSTKLIELGSCAFRQWRATHSHCQYIHGYQLKAKFYFSASSLDDKNWVVDFGGLKQLKQILNNQFDHTLCVAQDDPLLPFWQELNNQRGCQLRIMESVGIEKTAEWCFETASKFLKDNYGDRCWVERVEVFEHDNNSAIFTKKEVKTPTVEKPTEPVLLNEVIEPQLEVAPTPQPQTPQPQPVPVGNQRVTTGYSGLFDGISWGR